MQVMSIPTTFSIDFVGELEKVNELISKVGARIYYKGGNRNGTWITPEFAEKLNQTIFNIPIVATYNPETEDFEDHQDHGSKKAYGFVPSHAQLTWTKGKDGKEYLVTDVYLWTGYWPEAAKIVNKNQSMELDKNTIVGDWKVINGDYYFVYQAGAFKGLCALGDAVLPCFENSAFFNLDEDSRSFFQSINEMNEKNSGGEKMNEEIKTEEVTLEATEEFTEAVTTEEVAAEVTENTPEVTEDFSEGLAEIVTEAEAPAETEEFAEGDIPENTAKPLLQRDSLEIIERHTEVSQNDDGSITNISSTTAQMIDIETYYALQRENEELKTRITTLETENASLGEYKAIVIKQEKMSVIDSFKKKLSDEEISPFVESINNYSTEELKTKLSVVLADKIINSTEEPRAQPQTQFVSVPGKENESGTVAILRKHKKN